MGMYLPNPTETIERIAELRASRDFAEYELRTAVALARALGLSWDQLGTALNTGKQGASQWTKRNFVDPALLEETERQRIGRLIGTGERTTRYQVREIVSGRVGINKVTRRVLSTHLKREVAEDRCRRRGETAELWQVLPTGEERQLTVPPRASHYGRSKHDVEAAGLSDW